MKRTIIKGLLASTFFLGTSVAALAEGLLEKAQAGETIRIGFANEVPWAYPGEGDAPMGFAKEISDRVCFFHSDKIEEQGRPEDLFGNPQSPRTQQFLSAVLEAG